MRTLGLIGGMTWHSTVDYYRLINAGVQERLGGSHSADLLLLSIDFKPVEDMQGRGDWAGMGKLMGEWARRLEAAGAEGLVICTNTMHRLADDVLAAVRIPLIHIADATAGAVTKKGLATVGLLGTRYTMELDFYRGRLEKAHGLKVLIPEEPGRTAINDIIYRELSHGIIREESRQVYAAVIRELERRGAQGVILGCTEIPLLIKAADSPIPVFDTTALHAAAAVEFALAG
ncbi:MAG: aspartate/glutamate racemase family protein [Candidatus Aminicenantes bacterium]|nr:aspartate/glutamate racemase family protein [Candidatus Aminicenantes bacterium]